jgi:hypothetical protein
MCHSPGVNEVDVVVGLEVDEEAVLVVVEGPLGVERRATRSRISSQRTSSRARGRTAPINLVLVRIFFSCNQKQSARGLQSRSVI